MTEVNTINTSVDDYIYILLDVLVFCCHCFTLTEKKEPNPVLVAYRATPSLSRTIVDLHAEKKNNKEKEGTRGWSGGISGVRGADEGEKE